MALLRIFFSLANVIRLPLCLVALICVIEGYWLAINRFASPNLTVWMAAFAAGSAIGFANANNDIFDIETDRVNHPNRPIPSGKLSIEEVKSLSYILCLITLFCSFLAGRQMMIITAIALGLSLFYNMWAKRIPILGKLIVAFLSSLTIATGYFIIPNADFPLIPFLSMLLFLLARDFLGTVADLEGDKIGGRISECSIWGKKKTLSISLILVILSGLTLFAGVFEIDPQKRIAFICSFLVLSVIPLIGAVLFIKMNSTAYNIRKITIGSRLFFLTNMIMLLLLV